MIVLTPTEVYGIIGLVVLIAVIVMLIIRPEEEE